MSIIKILTHTKFNWKNMEQYKYGYKDLMELINTELYESKKKYSGFINEQDYNVNKIDYNLNSTDKLWNEDNLVITLSKWNNIKDLNNWNSNKLQKITKKYESYINISNYFITKKDNLIGYPLL